MASVAENSHWPHKLSGINYEQKNKYTLREKCLYSELFWFSFSRIWTEYGEILSVSPYSVQRQQNADQNNSEYRHFSHNGGYECEFPIKTIPNWIL